MSPGRPKDAPGARPRGLMLAGTAFACLAGSALGQLVLASPVLAETIADPATQDMDGPMQLYKLQLASSYPQPNALTLHTRYDEQVVMPGLRVNP